MTYFEKSLAELQISLNIFSIRRFQNTWNEMLKAGMIKGAPLEENNSPDKPTYIALGIARKFQNYKPRSWIYYYKKAKAVNAKGSSGLRRYR